jgi:hypothetical protein
MKMTEKVNLYYYTTTGGQGCRWGKVILTSDGLIVMYTDSVNGMHQFSLISGADVRKFILGIIERNSRNYFNDKMFKHECKYDSESTYNTIKNYIFDEFRNRECTKEKARKELKLLEEYLDRHESNFWEWSYRSDFGDCEDFYKEKYSQSVTALWQECLPKLAEAIRIELREEEND